jgi:DNA-binding CsgD family transcriptional regulator
MSSTWLNAVSAAERCRSHAARSPSIAWASAACRTAYGTGSTLAATARRMGVSISTVRSYLERIRTKWATTDQPVHDIRALIHEYPRPGTGPGR